LDFDLQKIILHFP